MDKAIKDLQEPTRNLMEGVGNNKPCEHKMADMSEHCTKCGMAASSIAVETGAEPITGLNIIDENSLRKKLRDFFFNEGIDSYCNTADDLLADTFIGLIKGIRVRHTRFITFTDSDNNVLGSMEEGSDNILVKDGYMIHIDECEGSEEPVFNVMPDGDSKYTGDVAKNE